jgi:hypothetical protein
MPKTNKYPPKTLVNLQEVKVFAATYVDGSQNSDTRFVAVMGDSIHFLHVDGTDSKLRQPSEWLKKQIREQVPAALANGPVEIPDGIDASSLPTD